MNNCKQLTSKELKGTVIKLECKVKSLKKRNKKLAMQLKRIIEIVLECNGVIEILSENLSYSYKDCKDTLQELADFEIEKDTPL